MPNSILNTYVKSFNPDNYYYSHFTDEVEAERDEVTCPRPLC